MQLMWFHPMPRTELPEDFRDANPSVWIDIHSSLFDPKRAHHMYNDFMDELEYASEMGFDAVCVNEHHSNGYSLMPSPNPIASALARRTTDTAICVMGNSLALYMNPGAVHEQGADPLQHQTARGTGHAETKGHPRRPGRPLVAKARASRQARGHRRVPAAPRRGMIPIQTT